jgi:hypothetical protein
MFSVGGSTFPKMTICLGCHCVTSDTLAAPLTIEMIKEMRELSYIYFSSIYTEMYIDSMKCKK